jgi:hypothetical protein
MELKLSERDVWLRGVLSISKKHDFQCVLPSLPLVRGTHMSYSFFPYFFFFYLIFSSLLLDNAPWGHGGLTETAARLGAAAAGPAARHGTAVAGPAARAAAAGPRAGVAAAFEEGENGEESGVARPTGA